MSWRGCFSAALPEGSCWSEQPVSGMSEPIVVVVAAGAGRVDVCSVREGELSRYAER